jgi:ribosomal protein S18 acetylase RimI-like enzyme
MRNAILIDFFVQLFLIFPALFFHHGLNGFIAQNLSIKNDCAQMDWDELAALFQAVGWIGHTKEKLKPAFLASQYISLAYIDDRLVGCGRAISDWIFYATIYDVVVHPNFQRQGIGKAIMTDLLHQLKEIPVVQLTATTGNEPFYYKLGLRKHKTAMARALRPGYAEEYLEN